MRGLVNAMRMHGAQQANNRALARVGTVVSYNPADYCAKVQIDPEGAVTGWLPVLSPWVGNGWGLHAPVTPGDQVDVQFVDGDFSVGYVSQRFFTDSARPLSVPSGEFWLVHKSGAFFKLTNDGKASFSDAHGASVTLNGDGTISSTGAWTHAGDLTASGTVTGNTDVIGGGKSLKNHVHSGVTAGTGTSGTPV